MLAEKQDVTIENHKMLSIPPEITAPTRHFFILPSENQPNQVKNDLKMLENSKVSDKINLFEPSHNSVNFFNLP